MSCCSCPGGPCWRSFWGAAGSARSRRRRRRRPSGCAELHSVEGLQLLLPERTPSPVDVLTNGAGAAAGAAAGWFAARIAWPSLAPRLRRAVASGPMAALAAGLTAAVVVAALSPFDLRLDERSVKAAVKRARVVPFGPAIRAPAPPGDPWSWAAEGLAWSLPGASSPWPCARRAAIRAGRSSAVRRSGRPWPRPARRPRSSWGAAGPTPPRSPWPPPGASSGPSWPSSPAVVTRTPGRSPAWPPGWP